MDQLLMKLCETPGISGAAILHYDQCIAYQLKPPHDPILLVEVLNLILKVRDTLESIDGNQDVETFFLRFQDGYIILNIINELNLIILTSNDIKIPQISVAVNVIQLKIKNFLNSPHNNITFNNSPISAPPISSINQNKISNSTIDQNFNDSVPTLIPQTTLLPTRPSTLPPPPPQLKTLPPPLPRIINNSADNLLSLSISDQSLNPSFVPMSVIRKLIRLISIHAEEDGKVIIRRALAQIGSTPTTLPVEKLNQLIKSLSLILPQRQREEFINQAKNI
ncbi:hypothetical protein KKB55_05110 [Myxococcota bacterium]|nr:hypothetical protein [Myxococcota bacterium]MBU1897133.1 hypothetical protein [Myxococcota bacterium]